MTAETIAGTIAETIDEATSEETRVPSVASENIAQNNALRVTAKTKLF